MPDRFLNSPTYSTTPFPGWYFLLQGLAVLGWWGWLGLEPSSRALFLPPGAGEPELLAFFLPDLLLMALGSFVASVLFFARARWVLPAAWLTAGGVVYAALYCIAWAWLREGADPGEGGWLAVVLMSPAALLSTVAAIDASAGVLPIFRRARPGGRHVLRTAVQIVLFWSFFLFVVPAGLVFVEFRLGWAGFDFPGRRPVALVAFLTCSALGLASGLTMARWGRGTPLPLDAPNRLVVTGPYRHLRNPMVVAGLGQGASVGLWLGSWTVLAYVLLGGLIWQLLVRPAEEANLAAAFGEEYEHYRAEVRCWVPRWRRLNRDRGPRD